MVHGLANMVAIAIYAIILDKVSLPIYPRQFLEVKFHGPSIKKSKKKRFYWIPVSNFLGKQGKIRMRRSAIKKKEDSLSVQRADRSLWLSICC